MSTIQTLGIELVQFLQSFHPHLDGVMGILAATVRPEYFIVFIMPLLFWNYKKELIYHLFVLMMMDMALGEILRALLAQPRPWWIADLVPIDPVTSVYSSPGGYSSFAVVFYGYLAYHLRKTWFTTLGVFMVIATGIAKMYEAATLPDHIILGIVQGLIVLYFFRRFEGRFFAWLNSLSVSNNIISILGIVGTFFLFDTLALYIQSTYTLPSEWAKYQMQIADRLADGGIIYATGFMAGAMLAFQLQKNKLHVPLSIGYKIVQSIVGLLGVILIFIIIRQQIDSQLENLLFVGLNNFTLAIICSLWMFHLAPSLFARLSLKLNKAKA